MTDIRNTTVRGITAAAIGLAVAAFGTTMAVAPATAAPIVTPLRTQAPGGAELTAKLDTAVDRGASRAERAAHLESGEAAVNTMDLMADKLALAPGLRYQVVNPAVSGDRIDAQLLVTTPGYPDFTYPISWRRIDGTWKLSQQSVCTLATAMAIPC